MTCRFSQWLLVGSFLGCVGLTAAGFATVADAPSNWLDDLSPIAAPDWTADRAAHLIERAGFGATPEEIGRLAAMTPQPAVDQLVDYDTIDNSAAEPFEESGVWDRGMDPFPPPRQQHRNATPRRLVVQPDAHDEQAARGKAHSLLARPLRDR